MSGSPTHAGAVVWREAPGGPLFLLVTAKRAPDQWVLPKGHIEPGETPQETARREVREEAGVEVEVGDYLGTESFGASGEEVVCAYYLARCIPGSDAGATEAGVGRRAPTPECRSLIWLPFAEAMARSSFESGRSSLRSAAAALGIDR